MRIRLSIRSRTPLPTVTPRYYDATVSGLMLKRSRSPKQFYLTYADKVLGSKKQAFVAKWGDPVERLNFKRGVPTIGPITTPAEIRERAIALESDIDAIRSQREIPNTPKLSSSLMQRRRPPNAGLPSPKRLRNTYWQAGRLKADTVNGIRTVFRLHCSDELDQPLKSFCTPEWVEERFVTLCTRRNKGGTGGTVSMGRVSFPICNRYSITSTLGVTCSARILQL